MTLDTRNTPKLLMEPKAALDSAKLVAETALLDPSEYRAFKTSGTWPADCTLLAPVNLRSDTAACAADTVTTRLPCTVAPFSVQLAEMVTGVAEDTAPALTTPATLTVAAVGLELVQTGFTVRWLLSV